MAIFHCSVKVIGRSGAMSAVGAAAYRAADKIENAIGEVFDFCRKGGVVYSEIDLGKNAPEEYMDRGTLWRSVEAIDNKSNSQLCREIEVAIPKEITDRDSQKDLIREYVRENFVSNGMCADWSIHDKNNGNPHAHILLTMRGIAADGSWEKKQTRRGYKLDSDGNKIPVIDPETGEQKVRVRPGKGVEKLWERENVEINPWNRRENVEVWRKAWADTCNSRIEKMDIDPIDHRSYLRQAFDQKNVDLHAKGKDKVSMEEFLQLKESGEVSVIEPTIHEGFAARKIEAEGGISDRCELNREILSLRGVIQHIKDVITDIADGIDKIAEKIQSVKAQLKEAAIEKMSMLLGKEDSINETNDFGKVGTGGDIRIDRGDGNPERREQDIEESGETAEIKAARVRIADLTDRARHLGSDIEVREAREQQSGVEAGERGKGESRIDQDADGIIAKEPDPVDRDEDYESRIDRGVCR